jgi:hypothetical protein
MAAIGQYLMEKNAEIQLARSAAPDQVIKVIAKDFYGS